jgi:hypothetical protein
MECPRLGPIQLRDIVRKWKSSPTACSPAGRICLKKNNRRASALILPLVVAFALLVVVTSEANRTEKQKRRKSADEEPERNPPSTPLMILNTTVMDAKTSEESQLATVPWWKGVVQISAGAIAVGLLIVNLSASQATSRATQQVSSAAKSTAEATARQLELSQRPWISIDTSIESPLTFTPEGAAQVSVNFVIRNVGSTPAKGLSVQPKILIASQGELDPVMQRSKICEENRTREPETDGTLFPRVELTKSVTFVADAWDIVKELNRTNSFSPVVIVCASYRSTFDDSARYTTGVIYYLRRIDPSHPGVYLRMKDRVEVPRELLVLKYDPIGAIAAN